MSGDWIKMRGNLWDDPRVGRLCDITNLTEATIIGGLYWLWASADQHSEDGLMPGLTVKQIDRKTGIKGFGAALVEIGWIADSSGSVRIERFDEHNGVSAKRRCADAQRKANVRKVSVSAADKQRTDTGQVPELLRRISELEIEIEKRREEQERAAASPPPPARAHEADPPDPPDPPEADGHPPTAAGVVCRAMRQVGMAAVNPGDPRLLALLAQGATEVEFVGIASEAVDKGKGWAWVLTVLQARRTEAAGITLAQPPPDPMAWRATSEGVFAMGRELGVKTRPNELFHDFERRVVTAHQRARSAQASTA